MTADLLTRMAEALREARDDVAEVGEHQPRTKAYRKADSDKRVVAIDALLAEFDAQGAGGGAVEGEQRFFIDHGMIHDRATGKHVDCEPDFMEFPDGCGGDPNVTRVDRYFGIQHTCDLLNKLSSSPPSLASDFTMEDEKKLLSAYERQNKLSIPRELRPFGWTAFDAQRIMDAYGKVEVSVKRFDRDIPLYAAPTEAEGPACFECGRPAPFHALSCPNQEATASAQCPLCNDPWVHSHTPEELQARFDPFVRTHGMRAFFMRGEAIPKVQRYSNKLRFYDSTSTPESAMEPTAKGKWVKYEDVAVALSAALNATFPKGRPAAELGNKEADR